MRWDRTLVCDDHKILGTIQQSGVECAMYVCVHSVLLSNDCMLNILGSNDKEKEQAGIELRRRVVLTLYLGKNYLDPNLPEIRRITASRNTKRLSELKGYYKKKKKQRPAD